MTQRQQFSDWVAASAETVERLGSAGFPAALSAAIRCVAPYEFTVIFAYHRDNQPIDLYDDFPTEKRKVMVSDYQEGPYLLDPFYRHSQATTASRLVRLRDLAPDRFYQAEYFRNYYVQTGLAEEIGFFVDVGDEVSVVISAMREERVFSAKEFRDLQVLVPFVSAVARQQWRGLIDQFSDDGHTRGERLPRLIEQAFQSVGRNLLTAREAEIVEFVLKGHSSEATARALGISPGTVRIHRRNIYAKLHIGSQGELFSHFISALAELE